MKKILLLFILFAFFTHTLSWAQDEDSKFGISFSGFVKNDVFFDSRQSVTAREGHFLLYPKNELIDPDGEDINAHSSLNMLAIQSRLTTKINGPDAFGAKTSGLIEGAYFGATNFDINGFRLRHAFVKLNWENTELLFGQYWHSMFVTGCYPGTVSFNTGTPFQFFTRNPQVRLTHKTGQLSVSLMAASQRDFADAGGSDVLRNAVIPELTLQLSYATDNLLLGVTGGFKQIVPRLMTSTGYKADEVISSFSGHAFMKIISEPLTFKLQGNYLQNGYDGLSLGGYAVQRISDVIKDYREYTNVNSLNLWSEIHSNGKTVQVGLFAGYSKNLGASEEVEDLSLFPSYTRGSDIASLFRLSPRWIYNAGKTRFALEYELTGAAYGKSLSTKGVPGNLTTVVNHRVLFGVYYFF